MKIELSMLDSLSGTIAEIYRPTTPGAFPRHVLQVLSKTFLVHHVMGYHEFSTCGHEHLIVTNSHLIEDRKLIPVFIQHMSENPLVPLLFENKALAPQRLTDAVPMAQFRKTTLYNEFYRLIEADYQIGFGFDGGDSRIVAVAVNRKERDFSDKELFLFGVLMSHLQQAFHLTRSRDAANQTVRALAEGAQPAGQGVICFDANGRVQLISSRAEKLAKSLLNCTPLAGKLLPERLRRCVEELRRSTHSELEQPRKPLTLPQEGGGKVWLKLARDPEHQSHCLIFECDKSVSGPEQLNALGLSARETDVAFWIIRQKTNWEIGRILHVSPRTVDKHVEKIFLKLEVNSRIQLVTKARELMSHD